MKRFEEVLDLTPDARAEILKERFDSHGAFYVYDLVPRDTLSLTFGERYGQEFNIRRQVLGQLESRDAFLILEDSLGEWGVEP